MYVHLLSSIRIIFIEVGVIFEEDLPSETFIFVIYDQKRFFVAGDNFAGTDDDVSSGIDWMREN